MVEVEAGNFKGLAIVESNVEAEGVTTVDNDVEVGTAVKVVEGNVLVVGVIELKVGVVVIDELGNPCIVRTGEFGSGTFAATSTTFISLSLSRRSLAPFEGITNPCPCPPSL